MVLQVRRCNLVTTSGQAGSLEISWRMLLTVKLPELEAKSNSNNGKDRRSGRERRQNDRRTKDRQAKSSVLTTRTKERRKSDRRKSHTNS